MIDVLANTVLVIIMQYLNVANLKLIQGSMSSIFHFKTISKLFPNMSDSFTKFRQYQNT